MLKKQDSNLPFIKTLLLFTLFSFFNLKINAARIGEVSSKWLQIETTHFSVIHLAKHQDLGRYYAQIAEQSYAELKTVFTHLPQEKITVIINDSTDNSNGYSTLIPYPHIMIYPVQVDKGNTLSESAEWAKELFVHELTHTLQLYPAEGYYKFLKPIMGTIVAPNLLMPNWWKEGMAVEIESQFSHKGRTKSYYQDASLRALTYENKLFENKLPMINETLPSWPYGGRAYLFGSVVMSYAVSHTKNIKTLDHLVKSQASRLPYMVEEPFKEHLKADIETIYNQSLIEQYKISQEQLNTLSTQTFSPSVKVELSQLTSAYQEVVSSKLIKKNKDQIFGFYALDKNKSKLILFKKENDQFTKINLKKLPTGVINGFDFHPSQPLIIYSKTKNVDPYHEYSDFYIYNYNDDAVSQITKSLRGRQPVWSINGQDIYYISTQDGKTTLNSLDYKKLEIETLVTTSHEERLHEVAIGDSNQLIYSIKNKFGELEVYIYDLNKKISSKLNINKNQVENIKFKNNELYFTSAQSGVYNLYKRNLKTQEDQILTHLPTGLLDYEFISSQQILGHIFTSKGTELNLITLTPITNIPHIENPVLKRYQYKENSNKINTNDFISTPHTPYSYLLPHYIIPYFYKSSQDEGYTFQINTSSHDPLHRHDYSLNLEFTSESKKLNYDFNYLYSNLEVPINVSALKTETNFGSTTETITKDLKAVALVPEVFSLNEDLVVTAGVKQKKLTDSFVATNHVGLFLQALYSTVEKSVFQIYPTNGIIGYFSATQYEAKTHLDSTLLGKYNEYAASFSYYNSFSQLFNHTLMSKLNAIYIPEKITYRFGESTSSLPQLSDSAIPEFAVRGYSSGQFFGTQLFTLNEEYRFPIKENLNIGNGSWPYFIKNLNGAIVIDAVTTKGWSQLADLSYRTETLNKTYWSAGVELRSDITVGYLLPMTVIFGVYQPFSSVHQNSLQSALGVQVSAF